MKRKVFVDVDLKELSIEKLEERIDELEERVDKLEKENEEKDKILKPLSIAVAFLCMFKKEELDKE